MLNEQSVNGLYSLTVELVDLREKVEGGNKRIAELEAELAVYEQALDSTVRCTLPPTASEEFMQSMILLHLKAACVKAEQEAADESSGEEKTTQ